MRLLPQVHDYLRSKRRWAPLGCSAAEVAYGVDRTPADVIVVLDILVDRGLVTTQVGSWSGDKYYYAAK